MFKLPSSYSIDFEILLQYFKLKISRVVTVNGVKTIYYNIIYYKLNF